MRLLEFNKDDGGANPRRSTPRPQARKTPTTIPKKPPNQPSRLSKFAGALKPGSGKVFPIEGNTLRKPLQRSPIDLEQLQQNVDFLDKRVREQSSQVGDLASVKELEQLQQRMKLLEGNLDNELWAAQQREHTMLEMLSKPPLKDVVKSRLTRFWRLELPAILAWTKRTFDSWWEDSHPEWWHKFARAWQESLNKARR
jgi:hypothetical protein